MSLKNNPTPIDMIKAIKELEEATANGGTAVSIAGTPVTTLSFTSDPQTQLNNKADADKIPEVLSGVGDPVTNKITPSFLGQIYVDMLDGNVYMCFNTENYGWAKVIMPNDIRNFATKDEIPDVTGKADKVSGATSGNLAVLDSAGNLYDAGIAKSDVALRNEIPSVSNFMSKVSGATANNLASLNSSGNVIDSGVAKSSVVTTSSNKTKGIKLSNGLILNWGSVTPANGGTTVNFDVPFTTTTYAIGATNVSVNTSQIRALAVYTYNTASFVCKGQWSQNGSGITSGDVTFRWVAIGK